MPRVFTFPEVLTPRSGAIVPYVTPKAAWQGAKTLARRNPYTVGGLTAYELMRRYGSSIPSYRMSKRQQQQLARRWKKVRGRIGGVRSRNYRKKKQNMWKIGERIGSSSTKWDETKLNLTSFDPELLNDTVLLNITKNVNSAGGDYNTRASDQVDFRGMKFCMNWRVEGAIGTAQAWVNVAVITPKQQTAGQTTIPTAEFFRNPSGSSRDIDFNNVALNNLDYRCCNINTDAYIVHKRTRFTLGPPQSTEGYKNKYIEWHMPVKRQIRYERGQEYPEGKQMFLVWWYSTSDAGTPTGAVRMQYTIKKYFKDTKM